MKLPPLVMLDTQASYEGRAVLKVCVARDIPVIRVDFSNIKAHAEKLQARSVLPVGSVQYLRECMLTAGLSEPDNLTYHPCVRPYLGRRVYPWTAGDLKAIPIPRPIFIKPARTKLFTGFVLVPGQQLFSYSKNEQEDFVAFLTCSNEEDLLTSANRPFQSEWRYYVTDGHSVGHCRYDQDGADDAPAPDTRIVNRAIQTVWDAIRHPFAIDVGVYSGSGKTGVVELNDFWALGLYGSDVAAPTQEIYTKLLWNRWESLFR